MNPVIDINYVGIYGSILFQKPRHIAFLWVCQLRERFTLAIFHGHYYSSNHRWVFAPLYGSVSYL